MRAATRLSPSTTTSASPARRCDQPRARACHRAASMHALAATRCRRREARAAKQVLAAGPPAQTRTGHGLLPPRGAGPSDARSPRHVARSPHRPPAQEGSCAAGVAAHTDHSPPVLPASRGAAAAQAQRLGSRGAGPHACSVFSVASQRPASQRPASQLPASQLPASQLPALQRLLAADGCSTQRSATYIAKALVQLLGSAHPLSTAQHATTHPSPSSAPSVGTRRCPLEMAAGALLSSPA